MPSLYDIQARFARAVLDPERPVPAGVAGPLRARPVKRFSVYRNNVYAGLIGMLRGRFPVVERLVGETFFSATARAYVEVCPPESPVLMRYGATFADFLDGFAPVADVPYLGDVARLEWARHAAYHAADATPLDPGALEDIPPETAESLRFAPHPSARLVRSRYPIVTIWSANRECGGPKALDAGSGGEEALIARPGLTVEVRRLPEGGAAFIAALMAGDTLGEAAAAGASDSGEFDLRANLAGLIRSGAIADILRERAVAGNGPEGEGSRRETAREPQP